MDSVASSWFGNITRLRFRSGAGDDQSEMSAGVTPPFRGSSAVANENVRRRVPLCPFRTNSWASCSLAKTLFDHRCGRPSLTLSLAHAFETLVPSWVRMPRMPLHMHQQLDQVFDPWFYFWKKEHWIAAQRRRNRRGEYDKQQYVYR